MSQKRASYLPDPEVYTQIPACPDVLAWKRKARQLSLTHVLLYSTPGSLYACVREYATGACTYYKHKDADMPGTAPEKIDAEPPRRPRSPDLSVGAHVWLIGLNDRWFLLEVLERSPDFQWVTVKPVTGWDSAHEVEWPHAPELALRMHHHRERLRHLSARRP